MLFLSLPLPFARSVLCDLLSYFFVVVAGFQLCFLKVTAWFSFGAFGDAFSSLFRPQLQLVTFEASIVTKIILRAPYHK